MEHSATVTLDGTPTEARHTGTPIREATAPALPNQPLLVQRKPTSSAPDAVDTGATPPSDKGHGMWPWSQPDPTAPPQVPGLTYDHTEYEDGTLHITLMEVHVPPAPGASATASDTFGGTAGGSAEFQLPAGLLSGNVTGKVSISRTSTYTVGTCTRVKITQPVQYARHYYRQGSASPDMVVTLLSHVYSSGIQISTDPITTCTCRTPATPSEQIQKVLAVDPGTTATINVTRENSLDLEVSAGFSADLPIAGSTSFGLSATGGMTRTTSVDVTLPGGYTYEQYDIGGVTYWEAH